MRLAFDSQGTGKPVILLHGLFASSGSWRDLARGLADRHRVISVDLRNHGRSPQAPSMSYVEMSADVLGLIENEGLGTCAVVGHCIGGKVAMAMALMSPRSVDTLCVIEAAPTTFLDPWSHQLRTMRRSLEVNGGSAALAACEAAADGSLLSRFVLPRAAIENAYVDWRCNLSAIAPVMAELRDFPTSLRDRRCTSTLHAILGADSAFVRPARASAYQPMFPRVKVESIEAANHWVHAACPDALASRLRTLLTPSSSNVLA